MTVIRADTHVRATRVRFLVAQLGRAGDEGIIKIPLRVRNRIDNGRFSRNPKVLLLYYASNRKTNVIINLEKKKKKQ